MPAGEFSFPVLTFCADSYSVSVPSRVTAVARKRPWSFCQKCRWQVTPKHSYTLGLSEWADCAVVEAESWNLSWNKLICNSSGNTQLQSSQLANLHLKKKEKKAQARNELWSILPKFSHARKKTLYWQCRSAAVTAKTRNIRNDKAWFLLRIATCGSSTEFCYFMKQFVLTPCGACLFSRCVISIITTAVAAPLLHCCCTLDLESYHTFWKDLGGNSPQDDTNDPNAHFPFSWII